MGKRRDIVKEFKDYYDGLSEDAKIIIHSILLVPKKPKAASDTGKSSSPAPTATRRSSSKSGSKAGQRSMEPAGLGASTEGQVVSATNASNGDAGEGVGV